MKKLILINGQWQGGGDRETLRGAEAIAETLSEEYITAPVSEDTTLKLQSNIIGCEVLKNQIKNTLEILREKCCDCLFTVGGGCDADVPSIAYLNRKYNGRLSILWLDAHGDLNAPEESESNLFYGMPLRALLGDCPSICELIENPLLPGQVIHIGGRDFDEAEKNYMEKQKLICSRRKGKHRNS